VSVGEEERRVIPRRRRRWWLVVAGGGWWYGTYVRRYWRKGQNCCKTVPRAVSVVNRIKLLCFTMALNASRLMRMTPSRTRKHASWLGKETSTARRSRCPADRQSAHDHSRLTSTIPPQTLTLEKKEKKMRRDASINMWMKKCSCCAARK
jgi:hypothetical protein